MKYFIDTEFIEGTQSKTFCGIKHGETKPTIDLISIGIVAEDGREYYAISKDFNLKEAWNRYDIKQADVTKLIDARGENYGALYYIEENTDLVKEWKNVHPRYKKVFEGGKLHKDYWIRDNVLKPIYEELMFRDSTKRTYEYFTYYTFKRLIKKYGKSNKEITKEIKEFCSDKIMVGNTEFIGYDIYKFKDIQFYGYYSAYDWVAFCWLFGKMIDLPKGFPMFAFDIQQQIEEYKIEKEQLLKEVPQINCHNSLEDARWNYQAYKWIQTKLNSNA